MARGFIDKSRQKFTPEIVGQSDAVFKRLAITRYEFLAQERLSSSGASVRRKQTSSSTAAGLALELDSSSTLERYVGIRAGALRWCVAVRIIARATCYDGVNEEKSS